MKGSATPLVAASGISVGIPYQSMFVVGGISVVIKVVFSTFGIFVETNSNTTTRKNY